MLQILLLHVAAAIVGPIAVARWGRRVFAILALAPASAVVWALTQTSDVLAGRSPIVSTQWVALLDLEISFRLDTLSWFMVLIVGSVGALVLFYCAWYFSSIASGLPRFAGVFVAFAGAMLGLVTTDSTLMLYLFWELTTVFSYLLIGHYNERKVSRRAAMQAILVTTFGGLAMLGGLVLLGEAEGGSYSLTALVTNPPAMTTLTSVAIICVLVGALSKSAIVPLHFWLPAAMAAPTPVSAYLHAAAMVKAGVYLVARLAPGFSTWDAWQWPLLILAGATMILGGYRALRQWDLKLVLAYGTVSQLGLLMMLVGQPDRGVALAGIAMLGSHAMFKATLFLTVGIVDAAAGTRDIHQLSNLRRSMPFLSVIAGLAVASMIGIPPLAGYVAKEAALEGLVHEGGARATAILVVLVIGSILTVAYGLRFWWGAFSAKKDLEDTAVDREAWQMFLSPTLLAFGGLAAGLVPGLGERLLAPYANTYPDGDAGHLTLWGGFSLPLLLTVGVLAIGTALFFLRGKESGLQSRESFAIDAEETYRRFMRRLDRAAGFATSLTQRGSLPFYLSAILMVMVLATSTALVAAGGPFGPVRVWDTPVQLVVGVIIIVAAILAARSRRRLKAVLLLGISGYGVALLYEIHGAPDLALTQVLVETVTLVVFVLVLRRLPPYFSNRPLAANRWLRGILGAAVGIVVAGMALVTANSRVATPVSADFPELAYVYGYGKNIVNVTLVDIRAWDTMGEISVLLVAATGVASLIFLRVRTQKVERASDVEVDQIGEVWADGAAGGAAGVQLARTGLAGVSEAAPSAPSSEPTASAKKRSNAMDQSAIENVEPNPSRRFTPRWNTAPALRNQRWLSAGATLAPQRRSVILEIATRLLFHTMLVFSVFLLFSGHNAPGGGFAGGLVAGIALVVRYLAGGRYELGEAAPINAGVLLGSGLFLSAGAGLVPVFFGGTVLQSAVVEFDGGPFGHVKFVTTLFFDIGVYLVVIGVVLDLLRTLGAEIDRQAEEEGSSAPEIGFDDADHSDEDEQPALVGADNTDPWIQQAGQLRSPDSSRNAGASE